MNISVWNQQLILTLATSQSCLPCVEPLDIIMGHWLSRPLFAIFQPKRGLVSHRLWPPRTVPEEADQYVSP